MFSAQQLAKMAGKKQISQETFDDAVRENIEDFDMEPDEALASAIKEFEAQGVDLGNIIKSLTGGDLSAQPGALAVQQLGAALDHGEADAIAAALAHVQALPDEATEAAARAELLTVLHKAGAVAAAVRTLTALPSSLLVVLPALRLLSSLLAGSRQHQTAFVEAKGAAALAGVLAQQAGDAAAVASSLSTAAAAATKNEEGKAAALDAGLAPAAMAALEQHSSSGEAVRSACALLSALTTADDDTQPSSRAFPNARALAKDGVAKQLVSALAHCQEAQAAAAEAARCAGTDVPAAAGQAADAAAEQASTTLAVCAALKQVAANDDICAEVAAAGGLHAALQILRGSLGDASLARGATALLRQLASSDGNKALLVEAGGLELITDLLRTHAGSSSVVEQALGLLTNITLRNPEASTRAVECGCTAALLAAAEGLLGSKENRASAAERQACMALRNIAVRCPDLRPVLLDHGAERLLRQVKRAYPSCQDVGSAALRDLGLDNYNE